MSRHRAEVRPRYGRIAALGTAVAVTSVALVSSLLGVDGAAPAVDRATTPVVALDPAEDTADDTADEAVATEPVAGTPTASERSRGSAERAAADESAAPPLPARSGTGRRVVFSESQQQVWLVGEDGAVQRTYPVSGSIYDNLEPGTFEVYSRSEDAYGIDDSGTMRFFVRFTQGDAGAAIGFHDIPVKDGVPLQGVDELGTPTSHGCIRQAPADARAMWAFAPLGTTVVVTA